MKSEAREVAMARMELLFDLAEKALPGDIDLSRKYIRLLKRINSHYKVSLPRIIKKRICGKCEIALVPGISAKVRVSSHNRYVAYICMHCGAERHMRY